MGGGTYNFSSRSERSEIYSRASLNETFTQNLIRRAHETMLPLNVVFREARDSEGHPFTKPVAFWLDITGSMLTIPEMLIKNGLPKLMSNIIQKGVKDVALMFGAIGDHETDNFPIQVGQFESGDEELDLWLTRTYLEGKGGPNGAESYLLAWYFTAFHTVTDAWEKRGEKGILITTGDEPCLPILPRNVIMQLTGTDPQRNWTDKELLAKVQKKWDVFHLHVMHSSTASHSLPYWKNLLGQNCIEVDDYNKISDIVAKLVVDNTKIHGNNNSAQTESATDNATIARTSVDIIL